MISTIWMENFYQCAVLGLQWLDRADPRQRRFGADAEARWKSFHGEMDEAARLDFLCRDSAVSHPLAFAPRAIFDLHALSRDEPFGPEWPGASSAAAACWLHQRVETPSEPAELLRTAALRWSQVDSRVLGRDGKAMQTTRVAPADRLVLTGASSIRSLLPLFIGRSDLDAVDQCLLISDDPGDRQLFGLFLVLVSNPAGSRATVRVFGVKAATSAHAVGLLRCDHVLIDENASALARDAIIRVTDSFT